MDDEAIGDYTSCRGRGAQRATSAAQGYCSYERVRGGAFRAALTRIPEALVDSGPFSKEQPAAEGSARRVSFIPTALVW